jgi:hypothetical protein
MKLSEQGHVELGNGNVQREDWKEVCFRAKVRDGADQNGLMGWKSANSLFASNTCIGSSDAVAPSLSDTLLRANDFVRTWCILMYHPESQIFSSIPHPNLSHWLISIQSETPRAFIPTTLLVLHRLNLYYRTALALQTPFKKPSLCANRFRLSSPSALDLTKPHSAYT